MLTIQELRDGNYYISITLEYEGFTYTFEGIFSRIDVNVNLENLPIKSDGFSLRATLKKD